MPLTASNAFLKEGEGHSGRLAYRVLAGMEALIVAGVIYLCASVSTTEKAMIKLQATAETNQANLAAIPALTIRVVEAEKDIQANTQAIQENKARISELERRTSVAPRRSTGKKEDDFSL